MKLALAAICLCLLANTANALDLNALAPCKPAAAKYCDRSQGITMASLLRCGAVLAAKSGLIGNQCRDVLKKYGQL
jgi:hypothetical protein